MKRRAGLAEEVSTPVKVRVAAVLCWLVLAGCPGGGGGDEDGGVDEDSFAGEGGQGGAGNAASAGISGSGSGGYAGAPMKSGGCTNTCSDANDGYCDDGPNADYDFCKLGTDCADCGERGPLDEAGQEPASYSTLCSAVSSTATGESLSFNCSDESVSCADFGLQPTEYLYSSRAVCLQDAQQVLAHVRVACGSRDVVKGCVAQAGGRSADLTLEQSLGDAALSAMISNPTQDVRECIKALREKHPPKFQGR